MQRMVIGIFCLCFLFSSKSSVAQSNRTSDEIVKCTYLKYKTNIHKYENGCIPLGKDHFCTKVADSLKTNNPFELFSGLFYDYNDPSGKYFYKISKGGEIVQYDGNAGKDFKNARIIKKGNLSFANGKITLKGILIYKDGKGYIEANEVSTNVKCFVGMPHQVGIGVISEILFSPINEGEIYYEPANMEINYSLGELNEVK